MNRISINQPWLPINTMLHGRDKKKEPNRTEKEKKNWKFQINRLSEILEYLRAGKQDL